MSTEEIEVDAMSNSPTDFWNLEREKRTVMRLKVRTPKDAQINDKVQIGVCYLSHLTVLSIIVQKNISYEFVRKHYIYVQSHSHESWAMTIYYRELNNGLSAVPRSSDNICEKE